MHSRQLSSVAEVLEHSGVCHLSNECRLAPLMLESSFLSCSAVREPGQDEPPLAVVMGAMLQVSPTNTGWRVKKITNDLKTGSGDVAVGGGTTDAAALPATQ